MKWVIIKFVYIIRIILTLTRPFSNTILDLFCWIFSGKTKQVPMIDNKILVMSATKLAEKIRKKELSALEVMQAYINRIKAVQPIINACIDHRFEEALADARSVDKMLEAGIKTQAQLAKEMPLLGVPFSCKEIIGVKNLAQTFCLASLKDRKAPEDSEVVSLCRQAGAIPVVVTNTPTMCLWWDTSNAVFGSTRSPFVSYSSAGGSSGGEGALISSAGSVMGIGNDLGGSIRIPSSFNGIYGHKPSSGIVSNKSPVPEITGAADSLAKLDPFQSTGPMCRYAEDLHLLLKVMSGNDKRLRLNERVDFKNMNIYYIEEFPGLLLSATCDVKASVRKAVKHFVDEYGATATKLEIKELRYTFEIWKSKMYEAAGPFFTKAISDKDGRLNLFQEFVKCLLGYSQFDYRNLYFSLIERHKKDKSYYKFLDMYNDIEQKINEVLEGNAILILPVHPEPPPHPIVTIPKLDNIAYTAIFNILGLPGTTVPSGMSNGLPIGLQVLAKKHNDHLTLAAAVELDKVFGGWLHPCLIYL